MEYPAIESALIERLNLIMTLNHASRAKLEIYTASMSNANGLLSSAMLMPQPPGELAPEPTIALIMHDDKRAPISIWKPDAELTKLAENALQSFTPQSIYLMIQLEFPTAKPEITAKSFQYLMGEYQTALSQALLEKKNRPRSTQPFGKDLAKAVAQKLRAGLHLGFYHRDYCGTSFHRREEKFEYVELYEDHPTVLQSFPGETEFVDWLSSQSDQSLARTEMPEHFFWDNQVITEHRLRKFLALGDGK